ncbi:hypothetical protein HII28_02070 [Planctomonas sp. JC2975]|uniref:hypothetical protein n=1 Tax=Planctomonas sp. JC2975 TaxID=2729626 RepID=UPI001475A5E7|nr:hypothetical protein [Planctomonas sp. JC2975]NNC10673.1 hypothetical protein [Planctomonas sp. JC2975]
MKDPTAKAAERNIESAGLKHALILSMSQGPVRIRISTDVARTLSSLLVIRADENREPFAVALKEEAADLLQQGDREKSETPYKEN